MASTRATIHVSARDVPAVRRIIDAGSRVVEAAHEVVIDDATLYEAMLDLRHAIEQAGTDSPCAYGCDDTGCRVDPCGRPADD